MRALSRVAWTALLACTAACSDPYGPDMPTTSVMTGGDWRDEVIYQIIVDRFADGDPNNDIGVLPGALGRYQGGDWQGIIDHMDYLLDLGVTTLWISPIVKNVDFDAGFDAYHGYWTQSLTKLNPHFGSPEKLQEMVATAHQNGMKVILDLVTNHMGQLFYYDINDNGEPDTIFEGTGASGITVPAQITDACLADPNGKCLDPLAPLLRYDEFDPDFDYLGVQGQNGEGESGPAIVRYLYDPEVNRVIPDPVQYGPGPSDVLDFTNVDVFHRYGSTTDYDTWEELTHGDFPGGLKDMNTERPDVVAGFINAFSKWIRFADFDGFRIDTLKHVDHAFWQQFAAGIRNYVHGDFTPGESPYYGVEPLTVPKKNWLMFGEAFDGSDPLLGDFTYNDEVDSVFYFSQKFNVFDDVVKCNNPTTEAEGVWNNRLLFNPPAAQLHGQYIDPNRFLFFNLNGPGPAVPDPVAGLPIYNQNPQAGGPVDASGHGLPPAQVLINFLDNHDVPRYMSPINGCLPNDPDPDVVQAEARRQLHNALSVLLTEDGIPCIYYGTEQEFNGGNDPANRENLFQSVLMDAYLFADDAQREPLQGTGFVTTTETFQWIKKLIQVRKTYDALRHGNLKVTWSTNSVAQENDAGIFSYTRQTAAETILIVTNVSPTKTSSTSDGMGHSMPVPFPPGASLVDVLADPYNAGLPTTFAVQDDGSVDIPNGSRGSRVLVLASDVKPLK